MKYTLLAVSENTLKKFLQMSARRALREHSAFVATFESTGQHVDVEKSRYMLVPADSVTLAKALELLHQNLLRIAEHDTIVAAKVYTINVNSIAAVLTLTSGLLDRGQWYSILPLSDHRTWEIAVKEENKTLLDDMINAFNRVTDDS